MDQTAFPFEPEEPELALEPVIGWRIWRLRRSPRTGLVLESPLRPQLWPPNEPMRARCPATVGRGRPPHEGCTCGLYAASSAEHLRVAGVPLAGPTCSVIGTVAMWGRVIEHQMGYRSELGYPDRIRLVCAACLVSGGSVVPTTVHMGATDELIAACAVLAVASLSLMPSLFAFFASAAALTWTAGVVLSGISMWKAASGDGWRIPVAADWADRLSRPTASAATWP